MKCVCGGGNSVTRGSSSAMPRVENENSSQNTITVAAMPAILQCAAVPRIWGGGDCTWGGLAFAGKPGEAGWMGPPNERSTDDVCMRILAVLRSLECVAYVHLLCTSRVIVYDGLTHHCTTLPCNAPSTFCTPRTAVNTTDPHPHAARTMDLLACTTGRLVTARGADWRLAQVSRVLDWRRDSDSMDVEGMHRNRVLS